MYWFGILLILLISNEVRRQWPVRGLQYISIKDVEEVKKTRSAKVIDLREAPDFYADHLQDAIHIYVGRLSFVWGMHLEQDETIVLVGQNRKTLKKAARILNIKRV